MTAFIQENLGGVHYRYKRGYRNVINKQLELNAKGVNCPLAIETSGHAAFRDNYHLDDGAYLITKIVIKLSQMGREGKELDSLIADLHDPLEAQEIRLKIRRDDFRTYGNTIIEALTLAARTKTGWRIAGDNREGIRIFMDGPAENGWFLVRLSVHDPIIPINIESDAPGGAKHIAAELLQFLSAYGCLDLSPLRTYLAS